MNKKFILTTLFCSLLMTTNIFAAHTHNDDCYSVNNKKHTHNDNCYTITQETCNGLCKQTSSYNRETICCEYCNAPLYTMNIQVFTCENDSSHTCEGNIAKIRLDNQNWEKDNESYSRPTYYLHKCPQKNNEIVYKHENTVARPAVMIWCSKENTIKTLTCTLNENKYYDTNNNDVTNNVMCNKIITSISPKQKIQTTNNPNFTVIATFLDGHTEEMQPTTTYNKNKVYNNEEVKAIVSCKGRNGQDVASETTFILTTPQTNTNVSTPTPTQKPTSTPKPTTITPTKNPTTIPTSTPSDKPTTTIPSSTPINNQIEIEQTTSTLVTAPEEIDNNENVNNETTNNDEVISVDGTIEDEVNETEKTVIENIENEKQEEKNNKFLETIKDNAKFIISGIFVAITIIVIIVVFIRNLNN